MNTRLSVVIVCGLMLALNARSQTSTAPATPAIPADAERAAQVVRDSPRHGEWLDIALPGSETRLHTWVVYPERKDKAPVVIVIHEIFGLTDWVRGVADQLAAEGFIAVAPDLLSGMGPNGGGTDSFEGDQVRSAIGKLGDAEIQTRLNAVRDHALKFPSATEKSASIGFCWGGSSSFKYAAMQPKLNAAVVYYGTAPKESETLARITCPVLGLYGGDDARVTSTVDDTAKAMSVQKKSFSHHEFERAGHGFLRQQDRNDGANLKAAREAWIQTMAFLRKNLEST